MSLLGLQKVIFSITQACNFNCRFCFPSHGFCGNLSREEKIQIITKLIASGLNEITFIGGEPTLCQELGQLIKYAKKQNVKTKIVTNGTGLTEAFLTEMAGYLDYITISVDSVNANILKTIGRQGRNLVVDENFYKDIVKNVHKFGYKLNINTVVTSENVNDDLTQFINYAAPRRWKLFQYVAVNGKSPEFSVNNLDFAAFCGFQKKKVSPVTQVFAASKKFIKGSCTMINHDGRFFDIADGSYNYSEPILEVGVESAFAQINVHESKVFHKMQQEK